MVAVQLPQQTTSFVGRSEELAAIGALLADPACRLLTLVGPGGVGKTRLAIQAAAEAQNQFADGVRYVALQPVSSTEFLVPAVMDALGLKLHGLQDPRAQLLNRLRRRHLLLVIDNFEHLLDDAALLTEILEAAPGVRLLVTSREALNVREEWVRAVEGMAVPDDRQPAGTECYDAVRLFVERARQARGDFALIEERPHVIRICRLAEGLPLAIELAAARIRTLSCAQIAAEMERSLHVLSTSLRNVPARHRDMYAVFEPCWNRLTPAQRDVFTRLAVFRGGFTRQAAEHVAGASLAVLSALVDKSLLRATPAGRYEMHELVRQYAEARLLETPEASEQAHDRHCDYYATFLAQREPDLKSAGLVHVLEEIRPEIDNIRAMWRWAVGRGRWDTVAECLNSLAFVLQNRSAHREAAESFAMAIRALGDTPSILRGRLLLWQGTMEAPTKHSRTLLRQGVADLGDSGLIHADPMSILYVPLAWEDPISLEPLLRETLAYYQAQGDLWGMANTAHALLHIPEILADIAQMERLARECLALYRQTGNPWGISSVLHSVSWTAFCQEHFQEARRAAEECRALCQIIDDKAGIAIALWRMGLASFALRDYDEARALFEQGLLVFEEAGIDTVLGLEYLAAIACRQGDYRRARRLLRDALRLEMDDRSWQASMIPGRTCLAFAGLLVGIGQPARAVEILCAVLPCLPNWRLERTEAEALLNELQARLPADEFAAAVARGQARDPDTLLADILEELEAQPEPAAPAADQPHPARRPFADPLSPRELEVLALVAEGWSNAEIAQHLVVTVGTVKKHLNNIFSKLHASNRTQAVARAREMGLLGS